jgi:hypothetical protein|tara:strand:- start:3704 stop:3895 length:192 start_codon:yes stop_codon:yes gene_type:complete
MNMDKLTEYLENKGIGSLADFVDRVKEIHEYNLDAYSDENPTLEMAYRELITDIVEEIENEKI